MYGEFIKMEINKIEQKKSKKLLWIMIALSCVGLVGYLYMNIIYPNQKLREEINNINKQLPLMIDASTRLDSASFDKNELIYSYTFLNADVTEIELDKFASELVTRLKINVCKNEDTKDILNSGKTMRYTYKDKNSTDIVSVALTKADCTK